jgi:hypothetical protein
MQMCIVPFHRGFFQDKDSISNNPDCIENHEGEGYNDRSDFCPSYYGEIGKSECEEHCTHITNQA